MSSEKACGEGSGVQEVWGEVSVPFASSSVFCGEATNLNHGLYSRFFPLDSDSIGKVGDPDLKAIAAAVKAVSKKAADLEWVETITLGLIEEKGGGPLRLALVVQGNGSGSDSLQKKRNRKLVAEVRDAFDRVENKASFDNFEGTEVQREILRRLDSKRSTRNDKQISLVLPLTENEVGQASSGEALEKLDRWLPQKRKSNARKSWKYEGPIMIDSVNDVAGSVTVSFPRRDEPRKHVSPIVVKNNFDQNRLRYLLAQLKRVGLEVEMTIKPETKGATARIKRMSTEAIDIHVNQFLAASNLEDGEWGDHLTPADFEDRSADDK